MKIQDSALNVLSAERTSQIVILLEACRVRLKAEGVLCPLPSTWCRDLVRSKPDTWEKIKEVNLTPNPSYY